MRHHIQHCLAFVLITATSFAQQPALQADWVKSPINGHWYGVDYTLRSWTDSEALAATLGGHLATIRDQAEQDWISTTFEPYQSSGAVWIGLVQDPGAPEPDQGWAWASGEPLAFTNWNLNEPNDALGHEDVGAQTFPPYGGWNDANGDNGIHGPLLELASAPGFGWSWPRVTTPAAAVAITTSYASDLDSDGDIDLAIGSGSSLIVMWNDGQGNLAQGPVLPLAVSGINDLAGLDHNQDGNVDLVVASYGGQALLLFQNDGNCTFTQSTILTGGSFVSVEVADLNADGFADLVVPDASAGGVQIILGQAGGGLVHSQTIQTSSYPWYARALDSDNDGDQDLVVVSNGQQGGGMIMSLRNDGLGLQWSNVGSQAASEPRRFGVADLNGDMTADLVIPHESAQEVRTYLGDGLGGFVLSQTVPVGDTGTGLQLRASTQNDNLEVVVRSSGNGAGLRVFSTDGNGVVSTSHQVLSPAAQASIQIADFDGDGIPDIAAMSPGTQIAIWLSQSLDCNSNGIPDSEDIAIGTSQDCDLNSIPDECDPDCNANGAPDSCDLAANPALDCDGNGTLDSCDLASDPGLDYDLNGVLDACECLTNNYCLAAGNSAGTQAIISGQGSLALSDNNFSLGVVGAPAFKPGIFFYAGTQTQLFVGEGVLCVGPTVKRLQPVVLTDAGGAVVFPLDFTQPPLNTGAFGVTPLSTWNFQFWYRDPLGGPAGFNLSDGLEVTFCP